MLVKNFLSTDIYYRLKIAQLLPHADKVIYFNTDVVVLDNIEKLWDADMTDYSLAAVEDVGLRKKIAAAKERLAIPSNAYYINSGVLIMNLFHWREKRLGKAIMEYLQPQPNLLYHDQDALNTVS